jgi:hypothetical protein
MACCLPCLGAFGLYHTAKQGLKDELGTEPPLDEKWDPRNDEEYTKVCTKVAWPQAVWPLALCLPLHKPI